MKKIALRLANLNFEVFAAPNDNVANIETAQPTDDNRNWQHKLVGMNVTRWNQNTQGCWLILVGKISIKKFLFKV